MIEPASTPEDGQFHSVHVPGPTPSLTWAPLQPSGDRVRVRDYTCYCRPTFYELCQASDQYFIRRTRRREGAALVDECARGRHATTMAVWADLLSQSSGKRRN
ncbi:hypothetical protein GCM10022419_104920 [Nonomuraea rosea]|uniref:Uncharacterized protein n=1 Tax=Nonomuraea rosea TaxID=638574 RepID=A0ABP6ZAL0_9ACTN